MNDRPLGPCLFSFHSRVVYDPFRYVFESQFAQICGQIDFKSQLASGIRTIILLVVWCKIIIKFKRTHLGPSPLSRGFHCFVQTGQNLHGSKKSQERKLDLADWTCRACLYPAPHANSTQRFWRWSRVADLCGIATPSEPILCETSSSGRPGMFRIRFTSNSLTEFPV